MGYSLFRAQGQHRWTERVVHWFKPSTVFVEVTEIISHLLAQALAYESGGLPEKAISIYQRIISLDPANAEAHYFLVTSWLYAGEFSRAIEAGKIYLRRFGERGRLHGFVGRAYHVLGDYERAEEHYQKAIQLQRDDFLTYLALGLLFWHQGKGDRARHTWTEGAEAINRVLDAYPENPTLRSFLAALHGYLGNRDEVAKAEGRVLQEAPNNGHSLKVLARAYAALGETQRAVHLFREAFRSGERRYFLPDLAEWQGYGHLLQSPGYQEFLVEYHKEHERLLALY